MERFHVETKLEPFVVIAAAGERVSSIFLLSLLVDDDTRTRENVLENLLALLEHVLYCNISW
jgi:hypothetical protein